MSKVLSNPSEISDNPSKAIMSAEAIILEMQGIVREAAAPYGAGDSVKSAINRSAKRLKLSYRRTRALWYAEARVVPAHEADWLRGVRRQLLRDKAACLNAELETLQLRLSYLEGDHDHNARPHNAKALDENFKGVADPR